MNAPALVGPDAAGRWFSIEGGLLAGEVPPPVGGADPLFEPGVTFERGGVNAHTHLYSGLASFGLPRPHPEPTSFLEILERVWWRLDRAMDLECLRAAARWYVADALLHGTTTLVDHHESPELIEGSLDILASACDALGMRAVLTYGATERNGGHEEATRGLAENLRFLESNRRPNVRGLFGLHASFTVSDETVRATLELCGAHGVGLHVHVAEDLCDVSDAFERGYAGPLERLEALGGLPRGSVLAHGVHLSTAQVARVGEAGAFLVHNPRSNLGNAVGEATSLGRSRHVALGTDGYPSDLLVEADALGDPGCAPGRWAAGQDLAAHLFGVTNSQGTGALADLLGRRGKEVREVIVGGRHVVSRGVLLTGNLEDIEAEARASAARLFRRLQTFEG